MGSRTRGFTIVELLVVIAIIGLLIALLLPAIQAARATTRKQVCANRFKQLGLAIINYEAAHAALPLAYTPRWPGGHFEDQCPGAWVPGTPVNPLTQPKHHNWITFVLPFLEEQALYDRFDFAHSWAASPDNFAAAQTPLAELLCPAAPGVEERRGRLLVSSTQVDYGFAAADYAVNIDILTGNSGQGFCELVDAGLVAPRDMSHLEGLMQDKQASLRKVTDGVSQTLMLFEVAGRPMHFVRGELLENPVDSGNWANDQSYMIYGLSKQPDCPMSNLMNCSNWDEIYSFHQGGANFLYGDGAVRFHTEDLDLDLFVSLFTRAAGDIVDEAP